MDIGVNPGDLTLPVEAVTETFGILGIRGSGKTTTARVMVEELTRENMPCVVIDPLGVWWGLTSASDGEHEGLPFTVLGGDHADVAITPESGDIVADLVVDEQPSIVVDLSLMTKRQQRTFMLAFVSKLYHRNRRPVHLVIDECDLYIPQRVVRGTEPLIGAMEDLVRRGRVKGLGVTLITQRPASVHKDVLSQVAVLVAHRLVGPQDRKAIDSWVEAHGDRESRDSLMATIAGLETGEAWFWSPAWLKVFTRVQVRMPDTFDSSKTPIAGRTTEPTVRAAVDVDALRARMAEIVDEAEASDPTILKRRIRELEARVAELEADTRIERVEVLPPGFFECLDRLRAVEQSLRVLDGEMTITVDPASPPDSFTTTGSSFVVTEDEAPPADVVPIRHLRAAPTVDTGLSKPERAILTVLAQYPLGRSRVQIALLSGYSARSSSLSNALGKLRSAGYVSPAQVDPIRITDDGREGLGDYEWLPVGRHLYEHWQSRLGKAERAVLDAFVDVYPRSMDRDELASSTGYSATSSSLSNALGKLRSLELIDGWAAHPDFMAAIT